MFPSAIGRQDVATMAHGPERGTVKLLDALDPDREWLFLRRWLDLQHGDVLGHGGDEGEIGGAHGAARSAATRAEASVAPRISRSRCGAYQTISQSSR